MWSGRQKKNLKYTRPLHPCILSGPRRTDLVWTIKYTRSCAFLADLFFYQFGRTILQGIFREKLLGLPLCAMG